MVALCAALVLCLASPARADGSSGTEFRLAFETNGAAGVLSLQILGESGTTGSVDISGLGFSSPFSIPTGGLTTVVLPAAAMLSTSDGVEALGVHVTANKTVVVYGLDTADGSADSYLALPVPALGLVYYTVSYTPDVAFTSQFAVAATADGTHVTVTPTATIGSHLPGVDFVIALDAGQVYQGQSSGDLTGTKIVADLPIAVFSGNPWAEVPIGTGYADHLAEQLLPTASWGTDVFLIPSALQSSPERFRIQASLANTLLTISPAGSVIVPVSLDAGSSYESSFGAPVRFQSNNPISVSHFAIGGSSDGGIGDPFLLVALAAERFAHCYLVATADDGTIFPDNFVNVVVPSAAVDQIELDGTPVPAGNFSAIGTTGYFYEQLAIAPGPHRLAGALAFGASIYGVGSYVSYASPAGGANPPFVDGFTACPEPTSLGLGLAAGVALVSLAARRVPPARLC
jgi:hypothetical protein